MSNEDGLILNIITSTPNKATASAKQLNAKSHKNKRFIEKQRRGKGNSDTQLFAESKATDPSSKNHIDPLKHKKINKVNSSSTQSKNTDDIKTYESAKDKLLPSTKKIKKKVSSKSKKVSNEYIAEQPQDLEDLLHVDEKKDTSGDIFTLHLFSELQALDPNLIKVLEANNFKVMTKIQRKAIPIGLKNQNCIIKSETGSGKTMAYLIPLIQNLLSRENKVSRDDGCYTFVICPTRELCIQVVENANLILKRFIYIVCGAIMVN